jgi:hypothetical protein
MFSRVSFCVGVETTSVCPRLALRGPILALQRPLASAIAVVFWLSSKISTRVLAGASPQTGTLRSRCKTALEENSGCKSESAIALVMEKALITVRMCK